MADTIIKDINPNIGAYANGDALNSNSVAVKDFNSDAMLAAVQTLVASGLARQGTVTAVPNATSFRVAGFVGLGSTFFVNWTIFVLWDAAGLGAAPQRERQLCSAFNSPDGTLTHVAFTAALVAGDKVLLIHPYIADVLGDTFNRTTDSLEAIRDAIDAVESTTKKRQAGKCQIFTKAITSAANAGAVVVATVTTQPVLIESIVLHSDGATTADLTSAAITGGAAGVISFLSAVDAAKANIDAQDEQVWWQGSVYFPAAATIVITLVGTGATAVDLNVVVKFRAAVDGGYLA